MALALDDHILQELLDAFKALEPRTKLVEQNSYFCVPQTLYPKFFKAPPLDEQVLATSNARGSSYSYCHRPSQGRRSFV